MGKIAIRVDDDSEVSHMRLTGESAVTIAEHGYVMLTSVPQERAPLTVDWNEVDARRHVIFSVGGPRAVAAWCSRTTMPT